ncbi:uncharacterized protein LOC111717874 isoform X2 [Eurytemora carolleeae]|nr:uncharacterized protein LOC111717874 isoform X2 [Eurytemora carolleeae]XP_023349102.1 uncharacterized protein LOC111717874 isoform X2 [Eurytemora carolleeae]|eukprot:XP_023349101.1 uncharacterized protein LOC111717874 isoform X2 [Eurytemora affinis]
MGRFLCISNMPGKNSYFTQLTLIPIINSAVVIMCPLPAKITNLLQIINIFTYQVWLCVIGGTALSIGTFYTLIVIDSKLCSYERIISLTDVVLHFYGCYFSEPFHANIRKGKRFVQCFQFFWFLCTLFIVAAWQCDLRASEYEPEITSLSQLADQTDFLFHQTQDFAFEEVHSQQEIDKLKSQMRYIERDDVMDVEEIIAEGACSTEDLNDMKFYVFEQQLITGRVITKVTESTATFVPKSLYGWLYKRDGDFIETIYRFLAKLKDSGVDIFIEREHFGRALKVYETQSVPLPLTLESFYLTFILYTLGLVVATTVFLYEMYFKKI